MRSVLTALVALCVCLGCTSAGDHQTAEPAQDGVLIHLTAGPENPHRVLMALQMAARMSESHPVAIYMDIEAVKVFALGAEDIIMDPFPSAFEQLAHLRKSGVPMMACPGCLAVAGIPADSLMEGVTVAQKETFFNFTDGRIVTLDY